MQVEKYPPPPTGYYTLTYSQVDDGQELVGWTHGKNRTKVVREKDKDVMEDIRIKDKMKYVLPFDKTKGREEFFKMSGLSLCDERFKTYNIWPSSYSKSQKIIGFDLKKGLERDDKMMLVNITPATATIG